MNNTSTLTLAFLSVFITTTHARMCEDSFFDTMIDSVRTLKEEIHSWETQLDRLTHASMPSPVIHHTDEEVIAELHIPGVNPDEINSQLMKDHIAISIPHDTQVTELKITSHMIYTESHSEKKEESTNDEEKDENTPAHTAFTMSHTQSRQSLPAKVILDNVRIEHNNETELLSITLMKESVSKGKKLTIIRK